MGHAEQIRGIFVTGKGNNHILGFINSDIPGTCGNKPVSDKFRPFFLTVRWCRNGCQCFQQRKLFLKLLFTPSVNFVSGNLHGTFPQTTMENSSRTTSPATLAARKYAINFPIFASGQRRYSFIVIRLAREAIGVPRPPMLTPARS